MKKHLRIAIFVESHEGYGHFNIVNQLSETLNYFGSDVIILSGTLKYAGANKIFNFNKSKIINIPFVDYRIENNVREYLTPDNRNYDTSPDYIKYRKNIIKNTIKEFMPNLIIFELFPFRQPYRIFDIEAVCELKNKGLINPQIISLCRDIIYNENSLKVIKILDTYFDRVFVRGDKKFIKLENSENSWKNINLPVEYMGNYINYIPKININIDKKKYVIVSGGGGYFKTDLSFFENLILSRIYTKKLNNLRWDIYISENAKKHFIINTENDFSQNKINVFDYLNKLAIKNGNDMIRILTPIDDKKFKEELVNATIVITRGGYNTTFELFSVSQKQLVIPRALEEQIQRANNLYIKGIAQIYPMFPILLKETSENINESLKKINLLSIVIDSTCEMEICKLKFDNNGSRNTTIRLFDLVDKN